MHIHEVSVFNKQFSFQTCYISAVLCIKMVLAILCVCSCTERSLQRVIKHSLNSEFVRFSVRVSVHQM